MKLKINMVSGAIVFFLVLVVSPILGSAANQYGCNGIVLNLYNRGNKTFYYRITSDSGSTKMLALKGGSDAPIYNYYDGGIISTPDTVYFYSKDKQDYHFIIQKVFFSEDWCVLEGGKLTVKAPGAVRQNWSLSISKLRAQYNWPLYNNSPGHIYLTVSHK